MSEVDKGSARRHEMPGQMRVRQREMAPSSEHFMDPAQYERLFGRPYVRIVAMPTVLMQDGAPAVGIVTQPISAEDWTKITGRAMRIPVITPQVRYSPTGGEMTGGSVFHFTFPTFDDETQHSYLFEDLPYKSNMVENPEIIEGHDGYRYFELRYGRSVRISDDSYRGWRKAKLEEPSGIVLRWRREDEEIYIAEGPAGLRIGL